MSKNGAETWLWLETRLRDLGMRKGDLARELGLTRESVSRWRHSGVPGYAAAYLRLRVRSLDTDARILMLQRQIAAVRLSLES